ncbi:MAG TPA: type II toxin-antitoxin system VapC family toxin [Terriglobales bacterium]
MKIYVDTSFLVSLYTLDVNSSIAAKVIEHSTGEHIVTVFVELEVLNALELRVFRKEISGQDADAALRSFETDLASKVFRLVATPELVFERAGQFSKQWTRRVGSRTLDLVHVAAAVELGCDIVYTFDRHQRKLADSMGLKVS